MKNRVKDIAFQSADHVIEEIRNMNVKGGSPFGRAAAWAFKLALQQEDLKTFSEIKTRFTYLKKQMYELKPTMATIYNSCEAIMQELDETMKVNILKEKVIHLCEDRKSVV